MIVASQAATSQGCVLSRDDAEFLGWLAYKSALCDNHFQVSILGVRTGLVPDGMFSVCDGEA